MKRLGVELDLECYKDFFLAKFYNEVTGYYESIAAFPGQPLDIQRLVDILSMVTIYTFNGNHYDLPMLVLALNGASTDQLKEANDDIIARKMEPWTFRDKWRVVTPDYIDHVDLAEVAPGVRIGLKAYMGRMHCPKMQDLPFIPDWVPQAADRFVLSEYCGNDLQGTNELKRQLQERSALREALSAEYKVDVRSKSDAQVAEAVFKAKLAFDPTRRYISDGYSFKYDPPAFLEYVSPGLQDLLQTVRDAEFVVRDREEAIAMFYSVVEPDDEGQYPQPPKIKTGVKIPKSLAGRDIIVGRAKYRIGIGGLHSQESSVSYRTDDNYIIRDIDVKSYYPSLILAMGMVPQQLGEAFTIIYRAIYDRRLLAKSEAERIAKLWEGMGAQELKDEADRLKTEADGLKIVLNGVFGKLFSKWSIFFAPELGIRVTMTGQLALLMLIERMEASGIQVVSANTDGIVLRIPRDRVWLADQIVAWWEQRTKLEMEATHYRSIHFRDVNNYCAITTDGKAKRKGVFAQGGLLSGPQGKHPFKDICADAVVAYLKDGTPIQQTILGCKDIRKFVVLRGVTGGGAMVTNEMMIGSTNAEPYYLGKTVRWYHSTNGGRIVTLAKGAQVAGSLGAMECMNLPKELPADIDYQHYIDYSEKLLKLTGTYA